MKYTLIIWRGFFWRSSAWTPRRHGPFGSIRFRCSTISSTPPKNRPGRSMNRSSRSIRTRGITHPIGSEAPIGAGSAATGSTRGITPRRSGRLSLRKAVRSRSPARRPNTMSIRLPMGWSSPSFRMTGSCGRPKSTAATTGGGTSSLRSPSRRTTRFGLSSRSGGISPAIPRAWIP